jgi:putative hemolysin
LEPALAVAIICAAASAAVLVLTASYEATFLVLPRSTLEKLVESRVRNAAPMLRVYEPRHRLRLMGHLGVCLGVIGLTLASAHLARHLLPVRWASGVYWAPVAALATLAAFVLLSTPRRVRFTDENDEPHIPTVAVCFVPLHALLKPLVWLLDRLASGDCTDEDYRAEKEEELRSLVESESESGVIEEGEREMIQGVFGFHDRIVREVMVPRVDIEAIEISATLWDLLDLIRKTGHSRVPVYQETLDRIFGVAYAKDLLQLLVGREDLDLKRTTIASFRDQLGPAAEGAVALLHAPHYVPETKKIDDLLHDMRINRIRLSVVFDEYGGTAGIVSTEDLIEEIVGEIQDEYDDEEALYHWVEPHTTLIASARIDIHDLNEVLETDLPSEGFETLGGFILDHLGSIPHEGQLIETDSLEFKILRVDGQRIAQVQISRLAPAAQDAEGRAADGTD